MQQKFRTLVVLTMLRRQVRKTPNLLKYKDEVITMAYDRMLDEEHEPTEQKTLNTIGKTTAWRRLKQFVEDNYDLTPELAFYGQKYGWTIRYRKSGKTFCSLFPEKGAFTVLVVLGKDEAEKVLSDLDQFSPSMRKLVKNAEQKRDGRWLWIRALTTDVATDVEELLKVKIKPKAK